MTPEAQQSESPYAVKTASGKSTTVPIQVTRSTGCLAARPRGTLSETAIFQ